jgi:hypothetical protein
MIAHPNCRFGLSKRGYLKSSVVLANTQQSVTTTFRAITDEYRAKMQWVHRFLTIPFADEILLIRTC